MGDYIRKTARFNGKKYEATGKTELEALKKLAEKLAAAQNGAEVIGGSMTVNAWYKEWMETYKKPKGLTEKSLGMYDEKYNGYIKPVIGSMKLKDVRDIHLQKVLNKESGKSYSHVTKIRMVLQQMFHRAQRSHLIPYDPAEDLELPSNTKGTRRSVTEEERAAILSVAQSHPSGLWIQTLLYTGMRPGETATLTWGDVDFRADEILVHTARESGKTGRIKAPKTAAGVRIIPIHAKLRPLLVEAHQRAKELKRGSPKDWVFPTRAGGQQNENSLRRLWTGFRRDLDIYMGATLFRNQIVKSVVSPDLCPYCLRHTFCTDLQNAGIPLNVAKELMGHADIQTTANIYTHKSPSNLHANMRLMDGTKTYEDAENNVIKLA